jgi:hypothetical protein
MQGATILSARLKQTAAIGRWVGPLESLLLYHIGCFVQYFQPSSPSQHLSLQPHRYTMAGRSTRHVPYTPHR